MKVIFWGFIIFIGINIITLYLEMDDIEIIVRKACKDDGSGDDSKK